MAFTNVVTSKELLPGGEVRERGTWDGTGVTTGTITADTTTVNGVNADITEISEFCVSSNGDTGVFPAQDVGPNKLKITFTSGDAGKYMIRGKAV